MSSHLTFEERKVLYQLNKSQMPKARIAEVLGRNTGGGATAPSRLNAWRRNAGWRAAARRR